MEDTSSFLPSAMRHWLKLCQTCRTHITGCTELPLTIFDLWAEFLEQGFLHPPNGWGLSTCLQGHLAAQRSTVCIIHGKLLTHRSYFLCSRSAYLKSPNVLGSDHKLVPFAEDSLASALTVLLFTLAGDGSISLFLCQVEGSKTLGCWGLLWGWR